MSYWKTSFTCKPTNKIKARREQHYIVLSRVLSNKLPLQLSTQNYIRLRQLIPVAVKFKY